MLNISVTGETMIFRNEKGFYSTSISKSKKNPDGTTGYDNAYINVEFRKGVEIPNMTKINITNGWVSFNKYQKDEKTNTYFKIFVNAYEIPSASNQSTSTQNIQDDVMFGSSDDMPF